MKKIVTLIALLLPMSIHAQSFITDFEWLEPNNRVEIVVGEPYQLKFNCSDNDLAFTSVYSSCWNNYDFAGGQHMVSTPTGYSINDKGVITGVVPGSYAIKYTGYILPKNNNESKMLLITVVSEREEVESNNTLDTANEILTKIRFGLYNTSDVDYFKFTSNSLKYGDYVTFKIHYYGYRDAPFGYKWSTFSGTSLIGSGSLISQDQECRALVAYGKTVYLEVYYDQSLSQYFNYNEEFVAEMYVNGVPVGEIVSEPDEPQEELAMINGHEYVDLGLPSGRLWAKTNYGASSESDYGIYVDWPSRSIIQSVWGKEWSTPTSADMKELLNQCTFSWGYNSSSVYGCTIKGTNGNSIFLPAAGFKIMDSSQLIGQSIFYWSDNEYEPEFAGSLSGSTENGVNANTTYNYSFVTMPIRPVAQKKSDNPNQGYDISMEYVDLALPSGNLWAKTNIGAKTEYDYGSKFAFGETTTKEKYMEDSYRWLNQSSNEYTKYTIDGINADGKTILESADDAAQKTLGSSWKTPTQNDFREMVNYCSSKWETINGVSGRRFTGANGNSIFMPAAGFTYWYSQYKDELGYYMTANVESNERIWLFYFSDSETNTYWRNVKYQGYSVRAITNKKYTDINTLFTESSDDESIYDVKGNKKEHLTKGLNIVRQKNGKIKKVIVK